ncbi:hypothetical protein G4228_002882 [Cervus hanglu yarkandensis]|nr:hypothetical protein G4228_002882 [Cervus hanglu yarkandensis]
MGEHPSPGPAVAACAEAERIEELEPEAEERPPAEDVHKETIDAVPNAIPGRTDIELEIYGMEGIPEKDMDERRRLLEQKTQGIPPLMPGVPPLMPGMPPVMPGMPPGLHHQRKYTQSFCGENIMMPMGGMMPPGPGIPPLMPGMPPGMPPPVPRPGIPPMTQAQAVSAPGILNRPPAPTATVPAPQPPVTKPLFPSAGQMGTPVTSSSTASSNSESLSASSKALFPSTAQEERRAQLPKYQRNLPRPGQAPIGNPPVGPIGGQYGGHHQGMPGYLPGAMPPYGQGPPMVPPYQGGPPRPPMGMRPPVMSQGGRY